MDDDVQIITALGKKEAREKIQTVLKQNGYELKQAEDPEQLFTLVEKHPLSIILLADSFAESMEMVLREIKDSQQTSFILLVLDDGSENEIHSRINAGIDDFLIQPLNNDQLLRRLHLAEENVHGKHLENVYSSALEKRVNQRTQQLWDNIRNIRQQFVNTVHALCQALYAKHPYTEGHSWRVTKVSERIAYAMGINGKKLENIRLGALFHDIGKIGIQDQILDKPGRLTEEEYNSIKEHPIIAEEILSPMEEFSEVVEIIKYEHENFDGTGYPYGIAGEEIPLGARIVRVADTYDAVVTTRAYQEGESHDYAIQEIIDNAGTEFCPKVTEYFLALFPEEEEGLPEKKRKELLGDRYEDVRKASRRGFDTGENFFQDLVEETPDDMVVIGDRSS